MAHPNSNNKGGAKKKGGANTLRSTIRDLMNSGLIEQDPAKEINAAARVRYAPIMHQYEGEQRASKAQTKRDKQYFNQYKQQLAGLQGDTTQTYDNANAQLAQAQAAAGSQDSAILAALNSQRQGDAQAMGAPASSGANPLAAAQASRTSMNLANQARTIGQGAAQESLGTEQQRIAARAKIDQALKGEARTRSINSDIEDLMREKGAFKEEAMRDYRDADRGFLTDLLNTRQAAQSQKSSQKFEAGENAKDRKAAAANASQPAPKGHPDAHKQKQDNHEASQDARAILQANPPPAGTNAQAIAKKLIAKGIDPSVAKRVAQQWAKKHFTVGGAVGGVAGGIGAGVSGSVKGGKHK